MSWLWARALRSITSRARAAVSSSSWAVRSVTAQPSTALSGVRSSCDSMARKSSFIRLADSASSRACCSRARSWALRSAMAAWSASWPSVASSSSVKGRAVRLST